MSSCPADFRGLETTKNIVGSKGTTGSMTTDKFPLGNILDVNMTIDLRLLFYQFIEAYVLEQFLEVLVIAGYICGEW